MPTRFGKHLVHECVSHRPVSLFSRMFARREPEVRHMKARELKKPNASAIALVKASEHHHGSAHAGA
jgi:hypothetical protein